MNRLTRWLAPTTTVRAHCDLPCGVYDPEQARIEAESVLQDHREVQGQHGRHVPHARDRDQGGARRAGQAPPRRPLARLLQARAPREGPEPPRAVLERHEAGVEGQGVDRHRRRSEAARPDRRDRCRLEGDRRRGEDPRRAAGPADIADPADIGASMTCEAPSLDGASARRGGPWRVAVVEASMAPAIEPGDWLLVDPTDARWPRRGVGRGLPRARWRRPRGQARRRRARRSGAVRRRLPRPRRRRGLAPERRRRRCDRGARLRRADRLAPIRPGPRRAARRPGLVPLRAAGAGSAGSPGRRARAARGTP